MLLALVGNSFLIDEAARVALRKNGFEPREVPRLDEELTAEVLSPHLGGSLFGASAVMIDILASKDYKATLAPLENSPDAFVVLLDAETWLGEAASDAMRKRKAQEARQKHYQSFEKLGLHVELQLLPTPQKGALLRWIGERAKNKKLKLEPDAAKYLADAFPDDPASIASELEKLALLDTPLNASTVARVVNAQLPTNIFVVLEHMARSKPNEAMAHLNRLLESGEDAFKLMGAISGAYQLQTRAWALRQRDSLLSKDEIAKALSVHPFRAEKALQAVARHDEARVRNELVLLLETEKQMKSGGNPELLLEQLVCRLSGLK